MNCVDATTKHIVNLGVISLAYDKQGRLWYVQGKSGNRTYRIYGTEDTLAAIVSDSGFMTESCRDACGAIIESINYATPLTMQQMKLLSLGYNSNIDVLRPRCDEKNDLRVTNMHSLGKQKETNTRHKEESVENKSTLKLVCSH